MSSTEIQLLSWGLLLLLLCTVVGMLWGRRRQHRESQRLLALHRASTALAAHSGEPEAVLHAVLESAAALTGASGGTAYQWDAAAGFLRAVRSLEDITAPALDMRPGKGISGQAYLHGAPIIVNDYPNWEHAIPAAIKLGVRASLGVPLISGGKCLGVLVLRTYPADAKHFTEDDARIAGLFADQAAVALTSAQILNEQRWAARHDALTGLPNRVFLHQRLESVIEASVVDACDAALLIMDLDRFKEINDTLGHHAGDLVLQQIGPRIAPLLEGHDMLARLGGDEFALLLGTANQQRAQRVAEQVLHQLEQPFELEGAEVEVGGSIGVALYPLHASDADTLLRHADAAMYMAKEARSGWALYDMGRDRNSPERLALVADLRRAIERDELVLHFQPKVDVHTGALAGAEALVRWPHPERGLLAPYVFIPLAEQTRLIRPLTQWAIGAALRQLDAWHADGLAVPVAVNLSAHDLQDPTFPESVAELVRASGVSPRLLQLEITEGSLLADPERARESLARLRALGVQIAIDDFGTGYSSLTYLQRLPLDELKIDRSFVKGMASEEGARAIVRAVIDLADDLGLRVVAEGVEDVPTWEMLAALGCDVAQGYYFSPPIAAPDLVIWADTIGGRRLAEPNRARVEAALTQRVRERGARLTAEEEFIARKRAEQALKESEERLRLAVEAAEVATWDWDLIGQTITWSGGAESLLGTGPGTVDRSTDAFLARAHSDDRALVDAAVQEAIQFTGELRVEHRIVRPSGEVRWVARKGRLLRDMAGRPVRLLGTDVDITDRKEAELQRERLGQAEKLRALGQMASGIAHDLNQSLLLIAGNGDLARKALTGTETDLEFAREALETMTQAAINGGETVKRLLTFGRSDPGASPERVAVDTLLHDVAQLTAPRWRDAAQAERRPITMQVEAASGAMVEGWTAALREALTNLVFNAVDALPDGGAISLIARCVEGHVCIDVADSGIGMDAETKAKVFEPFFTTKGARGSGLGLSQVFGIVERHRGRIEIESTLGQGTTIRLLLPLAAAEPTEAALKTARAATTARQLRILTVDDEPLICKMMKRTLRAGRHYVVTAASGEEALEVLQSDTFDLVISDVGLGSGINGWELAERIRRDWPHLSVVLATGWGAQIDPVEARQKGVAAVLAKPYRPEDLEDVLARLAPAGDLDRAA